MASLQFALSLFQSVFLLWLLPLYCGVQPAASVSKQNEILQQAHLSFKAGRIVLNLLPLNTVPFEVLLNTKTGSHRFGIAVQQIMGQSLAIHPKPLPV